MIMITANFKSIAFENRRKNNVDIRKQRRGKKSLLYGIGLKSITECPHLSTDRKQELAQKEKEAEVRRKYEL